MILYTLDVQLSKYIIISKIETLANNMFLAGHQATINSLSHLVKTKHRDDVQINGICAQGDEVLERQELEL